MLSETKHILIQGHHLSIHPPFTHSIFFGVIISIIGLLPANEALMEPGSVTSCW